MIEVIRNLISSFNSTVIDMEALNNYFETTRDLLNKKMSSVGEEYKIALKIASFFDMIYEKNADEREKELSNVYDEEIYKGIKVRDVMNISLLDDNTSIQFTLKERFRDDKFSPKIAREKQAMIYNQQDIFVRAILSNIIIIFEKFLSIQYRILVVCEPKKYFENKTINISDIFEKNIGEILDKEIDNEVNANMFDSIKALDRMFEKSSINLDRYIKIRKEFEEIYYRRNLFV